MPVVETLLKPLQDIYAPRHYNGYDYQHAWIAEVEEAKPRAVVKEEPVETEGLPVEVEPQKTESERCYL